MEELVEKHSAEAIASGFRLVGASKSGNPNYREYSCYKGHLSEYQVQHMRRGNVTCKECYEEAIKSHAESIGYNVLGSSSKGKAFRRVMKDCGCIDDIRVSSLYKIVDKRESGACTCKTCYKKKFDQAAKEQGITILENIDTYNVRIKFNSCGHSRISNKSQVLRKNIVCQDCLEEQHAKDVAKHSLVCVSNKSETRYYRNYLLPCGHYKTLRMDHARAGSYSCDICGGNRLSKESCIYLFKMTSGDFSWLKLGYSSNIEQRLLSYGLVEGCDVSLLRVVDFDTGFLAFKAELEIHNKFKELKLNKDTMKTLLTSSGFSECYPVDLLDDILFELDKVEEIYG